MISSSIQSAATTSMLPAKLPPRSLFQQTANTSHSDKASSADKTAQIREHFTQFVGETFYGQMIKSMQETVGKPAYFHGGRGEEVFRGQLNQQLAQHMTKATADRFAEPLFHRQFPQLNLETT